MKNLIMADLKILENKIWQIPLGIFVITILAALLIPSNQFSAQIIRFSLLPVTVGLLGYRLMFYSGNSKLHNEVGSLPCSKIKIVLQKYLMILFFIFIGAITTLGFLMALSLLTDYNFIISDLLDALNVMTLVILRLSIFSIPLFFKFKNVKTAFYGTIIWLAGLAVVYFPLITRGPIFNDKIFENVLLLIALTLFSCIAIIVIKLMKSEKETRIKDLLIIPSVLILPLTIFATIATLTDTLNQYLLFRYMKEGYIRMFHFENAQDNIIEAYRKSQIDLQAEYLLLNSIALVIFIVIVFFIRKKGSINGIIQNLYRLIFMPICFMAFEVSLIFFIYIAAIIMSDNNPKLSLDGAWYIAQYITFIPMFIVSIYYSKKFLTEGE